MIDKYQRYNTNDLIFLLRKWMGIILYLSVALEIIFFPSWANLAGCVMELIVWYIFRTFFFKKKIILEHFFSFLTFLSMFLARYIPLPATLLEGKPITYGFEGPFQTFFWETIMFIVASLAFYAAIQTKDRRNNLIQRTLHRLQFFKTDAITLWFLGFIGLAVRIQQLSVAGEVQYGDVSNKFLAGLIYLQYAPILMLFPALSGLKYQRRRNLLVWLYTSLIFVASFATNSRQSMIYPIFTIVLLFFLYLLKENVSIFRILSPGKILIISLSVLFGLNFLSDVSVAMLANRSIRSDIGRAELFEKTVETLQNEELMNRLRNNSLEKRSTLITYNMGWDENYLDNFMLNRYGNLRVSDQTIYYAEKIGFQNIKMQESFFDKVLAIYPLPILSFLGIKLDKNQLQYSPGDMLYMIGGGRNALGTFRVTSLIADGLATFGYLCFPILFILLYFSFRLLDCLIFHSKDKIVYSTLGLISVFDFLGMFRNSISCTVPVAFILREFWQLCITFWVIVYIIRFIPFKRK